jgi:Zn-dependent peptidase ImmA (M78 family)
MADAYYGAIAQFGNSHQADPAEVLGYVVAHELGHLLLGPGIPRAAS